MNKLNDIVNYRVGGKRKWCLTPYIFQNKPLRGYGSSGFFLFTLFGQKPVFLKQFSPRN